MHPPRNVRYRVTGLIEELLCSQVPLGRGHDDLLEFSIRYHQLVCNSIVHWA